MTKEKKHTLRWHPAFYAGIQIEFQADSENLEFICEHTLGTEPVRADMIIIRKTGSDPPQKNIGKIFRKYNVVEYKSPEDYLSIDDFYKAYGYVNFYKSYSGAADEIKISEITLTLVCSHFPVKLAGHLTELRNYRISRVFPGIYEIVGDIIPIQIILTTELSETDSLWLRNLTNDISDADSIGKLLADYDLHKTNPLYRTVMDIIVRANNNKFKEEVHSEMCDALMEILKEELKDELDKVRDTARAEALAAGHEEGLRTGLMEGRKAGLMEGRKAGLMEGRKAGLDEGIQALISTCRTLGLSKEDTVLQLMKGFSIDTKSAQDNICKYW